MRSSELKEIEEARASERPLRRIVHRDVKPQKGRNLRREVEQEFRDAGAHVWREEDGP
jgi:hypothetical protein